MLWVGGGSAVGGVSAVGGWWETVRSDSANLYVTHL